MSSVEIAELQAAAGEAAQDAAAAPRKTGLAALLALAGERKGSLVLAAALSALSSVLSLAPLLVIYAVLMLIGQDRVAASALWPILGWGALAIGLRWLLLVASGVVAHLAAFDILLDLRLKVAAKLTRLPLG